MIAMRESTGQHDGRVALERKGIGVPDHVDREVRTGGKGTRSFALAVGARELHHGDAGRGSRHNHSVFLGRVRRTSRAKKL